MTTTRDPEVGQNYGTTSDYPPPEYAAHDFTRDTENSSILGNQSNFEMAFSEESVRKGFIRKVYSILVVQLAVTFGIICIFVFVQEVKQWVYANSWIWYIALLAVFISLIALACCPDVRRTYPTNFIFLGIFTLCEGFLLGAIASVYDADEVLIAVGITAAVCIGLTIFAFQTKYDFTTCSGFVLVSAIVLMCFGLLCLIIRNNYLYMFYAALGALLFSFYLVFDTQLILGGSHKYSISPEEYVFAALNLYLDVINLFLYILALTGSGRG